MRIDTEQAVPRCWESAATSSQSPEATQSRFYRNDDPVVEVRVVGQTTRLHGIDHFRPASNRFE
ncbi:MAG: hypothetical protein PHP59_08585 [Methanofollis sp.]|uniref:hypothetical protein n=1 Tax=Methanofollis sp. TaxID=2052835 RepID=UPI0026393298|nr:hypothetical protein [Methanofollis sp.]MDD4255416.1 hypothetical protein [Methanofollis sp.]